MDGFFYYVMPYVDSETLRERLIRGGELPVNEAVRLLGEITDDRDAWNIGGGDGFHAHFDPLNNAMVLQSSQNGNAAWVNIETMERQGARPGSSDRPVPPTPGAVGSGANALR